LTKAPQVVVLDACHIRLLLDVKREHLGHGPIASGQGI